MNPTKNFDDLVALIHLLRQKCDWDKKQTNETLVPYIIEEGFELVDAIMRGDKEDSKLELGDVLLQVMLQSEIYAEQGAFDVGDVIYALQDKMIRRHPHVFLADIMTADEIVAQWETIKQEEKKSVPKRLGDAERFLDDIKSGTALMIAQAIQKRASKVGFDMNTVAECFDKLQEELAEVKGELADFDKVKKRGTSSLSYEHKKRLTDELGDCLFALVNIARKLDIDSETALQSTIAKFRTRFCYIEQKLTERGICLDEAGSELMNDYWEEAKNY